MPTVTYADGVPCWVDLSTPDPDAAAAFYAGLLGVEAPPAGPVEETGGYRILLKDGKTVGGLMPHMQPGQPTVWSTYFWTDDLDATAARVGAAGGQTMVEPMDVMDVGRMAFFIDPTGAAFGCWQPGTNRGAQVVNEPGTFCWNELNTRDMETAKAFYAEALGITGTTSAEGPMTYTEFSLADGRVVAGGMDMPPQVPAAVPAHWLVYFAVEDADAAVAKVRELGGSVMLEPMTIPVGRFAVVADPQGAAFAVIALSGA